MLFTNKKLRHSYKLTTVVVYNLNLMFGDQPSLSTVPLFLINFINGCTSLVAFNFTVILLQISPSQSDEDDGSHCTALVSWTLQVIIKALRGHNFCKLYIKSQWTASEALLETITAMKELFPKYLTVFIQLSAP